MKIIGLFPRFLPHRRNQDYLYHHALAELYRRMGHSFQIVPDMAFSLKASFYYLAQRQARYLRRAPRLLATINRRHRHISLPRRLVRPDLCYHSNCYVPPAVASRLILETEFYDYAQTPAGRVSSLALQLPVDDVAALSALVVRTEISRQFFLRNYSAQFASKVHVVPFFMPYLEHWVEHRPQKPDPARGINFIFVGNQAHRKGLDYFLELRRAMLAAGTPVRFIVVSNFQDGIDFDLTGVEVHRGIAGEKVRQLMEQAHYLVLPTRGDMHPKVMYEGCAAGCTLIYSDLLPLRDIWRGCGYEVPLRFAREAIRELAVTLARQAGDEERGRQNYLKFLAEFAPGRVLSSYADILASVPLTTAA